MLSEEEKKAIEMIKYLKKYNTLIGFRIYDRQKLADTILKLITKLQKEKEHQTEKINNQKAELAILNEKQKDMNKLINDVKSYEGQFKRQEKEIREKNKQIDLITSFIYKALCKYPGTISHALRENGFNDEECANCEPADKKVCKDCIKQYFEQLAKEKGE